MSCITHLHNNPECIMYPRLQNKEISNVPRVTHLKSKIRFHLPLKLRFPSIASPPPPPTYTHHENPSAKMRKERAVSLHFQT